MKHWIAIALSAGLASASYSAEQPTLDNPVSVDFLQEHLTPTHPRLVFTPSSVQRLKEELDRDPVLKNMYAAIRLNAEEILDAPLLTRKVVGRRLLHTSREMVYRVTTLGLVFLIEDDPGILSRINDELLAVCGFEDWNPSHFLDTAEMSMAIALALDWTDGHLPQATARLARKALIVKGLRPSWPEDGKTWRIAYRNNNWNEVCNGGLIAAALAVAEDEPQLAADTIRRALDGLPNALAEYSPDGVYPEGSSYWGYGASYTVMTINMLESALGRDFGISRSPGFMESAVFRVLSKAPSGMYYNFADCSDHRSAIGDITLAWFAAQTGNSAFFEEKRFLQPPESMGNRPRFTGAAMAWLSRYEANEEAPPLPTSWKGEGANPIVIFRGGEDDPHEYYFGGKGGRASSNHGNMDAGSFVFELEGVRWVVDPGNQNYHALEKTGFNLWGKQQGSERWNLLTKNNFGHSTLTINGEPFLVDGFAPLIDFKGGEQPEASFDLTEVYGGNVEQAVRRFIKESPVSLVIEDHIELSEDTQTITWQLMTVAEVEAVESGAVLSQEGQTLHLEILSHPAAGIVVVSLDPPPMELDRNIKGLKRLEIQMSAEAAVDDQIVLRIRVGEHS